MRGILAEVYLAMTGGQAKLVLGAETAAPGGRPRSDAANRPVASAPLPVVAASEEEMAAHEHVSGAARQGLRRQDGVAGLESSELGDGEPLIEGVSLQLRVRGRDAAHCRFKSRCQVKGIAGAQPAAALADQLRGARELRQNPVRRNQRVGARLEPGCYAVAGGLGNEQRDRRARAARWCRSRCSSACRSASAPR